MSMTDKEQAQLNLKIAREEYGEPDFAPWWVVLLSIAAIAVIGALIWFLWSYLQTPSGPTA